MEWFKTNVRGVAFSRESEREAAEEEKRRKKGRIEERGGTCRGPLHAKKGPLNLF